MNEHPPSSLATRCPYTLSNEPLSPARLPLLPHQPMHQLQDHRPTFCLTSTATSSCPSVPCADNDETATCSYCGECATHPFDPIVVVCACKTRPVHASCLHRWVRARPQTGAERFRCEVCGCAYMDGRLEFAAWLLAVGVWGGFKRWWDEAVAALVGGSGTVDGRGGMMMDDEDHPHAPNCAQVTKDKMSASTSSVTYTIY